MKHIVEPGSKFGRLTVVKRSDRSDKHGNRFFDCICDCGQTKSVRRWCLTNGNTKSCGCLAKEVKRKNNWKGEGEVPKNVFNILVKNAKQRQIELSISLKYIADLYDKQNGRCAISGLPIDFGKTTKSKRSASLDRIDNTKGYEKGNVWWVHTSLNIMKSTHSMKEFTQWCQFVVDYSNGEKDGSSVSSGSRTNKT